MLDFLRRYFGLGHVPEQQVEAPPPPVDDAYILEAIARARGYPSAQALAAAEPRLVSSFEAPAPSDWVGDRPPLTPEELEAQMQSLESWLGPLDNVSRLLGAIATGQNPLRVWDDRLPPEERPPTVSDALGDRGVPPWLALLPELFLPDGLGPFDEALRGARHVPEVLEGLQYSAMALPASRLFRNRPDVLEALARPPEGQGAEAMLRGLVTELGAQRTSMRGANGGNLHVLVAPDGSEIRLSGPVHASSDVPYVYVDSMRRPESRAGRPSIAAAQTLQAPLFWADKYQTPLVTTPSAFAHRSMTTDQLYKMYNDVGFELTPGGHMARHPLPLDDAAREAELALRREAFRELYPLLQDRTIGWRMSAYGSSVPATSVLRFDPATGQLMMRHADSPDWVPYRNDAGQTIRREGDTIVFEGPEYIERVDLRDNSVQVEWREGIDPAARRAERREQLAPVLDPSMELRLADPSQQRLLEQATGGDVAGFMQRYFAEPSLARRTSLVQEALDSQGLEGSPAELVMALDAFGAPRDLIPRRTGSLVSEERLPTLLRVFGDGFRLGDAELDEAVDRAARHVNMEREQLVEALVGPDVGAAEWVEQAIVDGLVEDGVDPARARDLAGRVREAYEDRLGIDYIAPRARPRSEGWQVMATAPAELRAPINDIATALQQTPEQVVEMFVGDVADRWLAPYEARRALYEAGYSEDEIERALEGLEALASERARRASAAQQTSGSPGRPPEESAVSGRRSPTSEFDYVAARAPGGEGDWVDLFLSEGEDAVLRQLREAQSLLLGDDLWRRRGYPSQEAFEKAFLLGVLARASEAMGR